MVDAFPAFQPYFVAAPDKIKGVGGIACTVFGELRNVPLSLGDDQAPGSIVQGRFRVTEGQGYQIILGMDLMVPLHVTVHTGCDVITYRRGCLGQKKEPVTLEVFKRNTVRLSPAARQYRDFHAKAVGEAECAAATLLTDDQYDQANCLGSQVEPAVLDYVGPSLRRLVATAALLAEEEASGQPAAPEVDDKAVEAYVASLHLSPPGQGSSIGEACPAPGGFQAAASPPEVLQTSSIGEDRCYATPVDPLLASLLVPPDVGVLPSAAYKAMAVEQDAAVVTLADVLPQYVALTTMEELGKKRPKKGKKVPASHIRGLLMRAAKNHVALEGPRGIGKSSVLQALPQAGYDVVVAPPGLQSKTFDPAVFAAHVSRWKKLQEQDTALLIESSPWGYLLRLGTELPRENHV